MSGQSHTPNDGTYDNSVSLNTRAHGTHRTNKQQAQTQNRASRGTHDVYPRWSHILAIHTRGDARQGDEQNTRALITHDGELYIDGLAKVNIGRTLRRM